MGYGFKRSGAIKSTLTRQLQTMKKTLTVHVVRSKSIDGAAIAAQAEFWLRQGVSFDERRLANSLLQFSHPDTFPSHSTELNVLEYLKFAARRETLPTKSKIFPYNYSSILTLIGILLNLPDYHISNSLSSFGQKLIKIGVDKVDRPRGFTCAGFVLACIGAVALKDEIAAVTGETGWASRKDARRAAAGKRIVIELQCKKFNAKLVARIITDQGLHDMLTKEQLERFDVQRLAKKLTPLLANLNPHQPSVEMFFHAITTDPDNWEYFGCMAHKRFYTKNLIRKLNGRKLRKFG